CGAPAGRMSTSIARSAPRALDEERRTRMRVEVAGRIDRVSPRRPGWCQDNRAPETSKPLILGRTTDDDSRVLRFVIVISAAVLFSACAEVKPWERGTLALPAMDPSAPARAMKEEFVH